MTSALMYVGRFPAWKGNSRGLVEANGEADSNSVKLLGACTEEPGTSSQLYSSWVTYGEAAQVMQVAASG